jgi:hypothetical protein
VLPWWFNKILGERTSGFRLIVRRRFAQENNWKLKEWSNEQAFVRVFELSSGYWTIGLGAIKKRSRSSAVGFEGE